MGFHDTQLHRQPTDLYAHVRIAYAEGLAGKPFAKPYRTPFRRSMWAQEQAFAAWMDGRDAREQIVQRRIAQNQDALDQAKVDRAVSAQPHAFKEFPGHTTALSPAGAGAATAPPVAAPERSV